MTADVDGLAVHERGHGPGILWLHGYTMDSSVWAQIWRALPGWRHVGLDLPWHGRSRDLRDEESLASLADMVAGWAPEAAITHVVGLSFGSVLALELALRHPSAFRSWVLSAPSVVGADTDPQVERRYGQLWQMYHCRGPGPHMTRLWVSCPPDLFAGVLARPALRDLMLSGIDAHQWRELNETGLRRLTNRPQDLRELSALSAPMLVVTGEYELVVHQAAAEAIAVASPRARREVLLGAGHLAMLEEPAAAAALVAQHWVDAHTSADRLSGVDPPDQPR